MERIIITCPFTGLEFEAIKYADGRIVTANKITGEEIRLNYNCSIGKYMLDGKMLRHVPVMTMTECAKELGISKPRVSVLVKQGRLTAIQPDVTLYVTRESLLEYKRSRRKAGKEN